MPPPQVRFLHRALDVVGGAEIQLTDQARYLRRAGAEVSIRTLVYEPTAWENRLGDMPVEAWFRVARDGKRPRLTRTLGRRRLRWLLRELEATDVSLALGYPVSAALGAAKSRGVRLWHCLEAPRWLYPEDANPYLARHHERAPLRHGPHYYRTSLASPVGALPFIGRRRPSRAAADRDGVSGLTAVWANSEYTRDSVRRIYPSVSAEVLYPGVSFGERLRTKAPLARDGLRVICITRVELVKNLDTLLDGFGRYRQRTDPHAKLSIVGKGPALPALQELARETGLGNAVTFHGFVPDAELDELCARHDVFACIPLDEPFGLVFPEAIARGLLALGPDHGGPTEILDHGKLGELVDPLEPDAIAGGLARIRRLTDAEVDRRRAAADDACRERYSHDVVARRMVELLGGLGVELAKAPAS
ncbi:MAG TPA: glycosyltransferase family 4 protein [Polyangiaceae bacterium]|nr:glycosyltransferase family 4 protein [Polyangiaceae bacterium]